MMRNTNVLDRRAVFDFGTTGQMLLIRLRREKVGKDVTKNEKVIMQLALGKL